jgi:tripartite ATP-independent transporter DctP family solute receptor
MLERRTAIAGAGALAMAAFSGVTSPAQATPQLISLVFNGYRQSTLQIGADSLRAKLAELTAGDLSADERGGASQGSEAAILAATRSGAIDLAVVSGLVVSAVVPEMGVFDVPFLFRDVKHAEDVAEGPVGTAIAAKFADKGLVLLAIGKQGFRNITNSKRPIRVPADLVGLKIRVFPNELNQMAFQAPGADVVPMDFPLLYGALKDGQIDGQENPVVNIAGYHMGEVQKFLNLTQHVFAVIVFVAHRESLERLSPADQAAIRAAARAGADATWRAGAEEDAKALASLRGAGMEIIETVDRAPFVDAMRPLEPEFERRFGKGLLATIRSTP